VAEAVTDGPELTALTGELGESQPEAGE